MRSRFSATRDAERARARLAVLGGLCLGCGPTNGVVGAMGAEPGAAGPTFEAQFAADDANWQKQTSLPGAQVAVGTPNTEAVDGLVARLVLPGHPEYQASDGVGPDLTTQLGTSSRFGFGTYRARVAFGSCQPGEEAVSAVLGYFNDGADHNGNGVTDDVEIDLQMLCGTPSFAYLSVFTDYQASAAGSVQFRKLAHIIDFSTGDTYDTPRDDTDGFAPSGNDPALLLPTLLGAGTFYELGFEWHSGSLRFFLDVGGTDRTLWLLDDPAHVPSLPVEFLFNLWHPDTHWYPASAVADYPSADVVMQVDWLRYWAE
jgi:hypothetical protein